MTSKRLPRGKSKSRPVPVRAVVVRDVLTDFWTYTLTGRKGNWPIRHDCLTEKGARIGAMLMLRDLGISGRVRVVREKKGKR